MDKQAQYEALVAKVKAAYQERGADYDLIWCEECREINLWTYWQGKNTLDPDILLVGQDWGCVTPSGAEQYRQMNEGKQIPYYTKENKSPTDDNLVELFSQIGFDIQSGYDPRLFFTNLVLGYRKKGTSGNFSSVWAEKDAPFFRELVEILEPNYVLCLGKDTFTGVLKALNIALPNLNRYNAFIESESNPILYGNLRICALAHCGTLGTLNRNRNASQLKNDLALQKADWQRVLASYTGIKSYHKLVRDRIPEIIEASGKRCTTEILSDAEYLRMLDLKLDEELAEYHKDQNIEELADLLEVIHGCAVARGYSLADLERVRAEKAAKRGGFEKKILLKEVIGD